MFLAIREMKHAKFKYLLIGLIMVLIAWLVFFVSGLAQGLSSDNASAIQKMDADYIVLQQDAEHRITRSMLTEQQLNDVNQYVDKKNTEPLGVQMTTVTKGDAGKKVDVTFFAVNTKGALMPSVVEGKQINNETKNQVIADISLKDEGIAIGDKVTDEISGQTFTISGFTKNQSFSHAPVIFMNYEAWKAMYESKITKGQLGFNAIALKANEDQITSLEDNMANVDVITINEALKGIPGYSEEQGSLLMMIVFLFIIAAFVLAVFFYVITIQKMSQFGVLKAIGAKFTYLAKNIISQVILLSVISLVISIALTYGISLLLPSSMPFDLSIGLVAGCSGLFLAVAVIGSLLSLYRVAKVDAVEAIGRAA
ncbi:ABC transporter permease [Bacillus massiliigorillae]|uniref:ABC transporter permease n=1 Tax=Bacillus massiliigorillae TaxID=1243664 RepID=UPI00039ADE94|nr:ABC transporter permease [Bacillus massiliigorillae]